MNGRELKARLAQLMQQHHVRPLERAPIPLLSPISTPQIIEGIASTSDIDADRMAFARGSLTWSKAIPLLIRHDTNRIAGKILDLRSDDNGNLCIRAQVDDPEARRMAGFSIAATVIESEVRDEASPSGFHSIILQATLDEVSITDRPSNARAIITSRRDVSLADNSADTALAAAYRAQKMLERLCENWSQPVTKAAPRHVHDIKPASGLILSDVPLALLTRSRNPFRDLVARLSPGGD